MRVLSLLIALGAVAAPPFQAKAQSCHPGEIERRIYSLENSNEDAAENIRILNETAYRLRLDYCDAGQGMIRVLEATGSGGTASVREIFRAIADASARSYHPVTTLAHESAQIVRFENSAEDAAGTVRVAEEVSRFGEADALEALEAAAKLTAGLGSGATADIRESLRVVARIAERSGHLSYLADKQLELNRLENTPADALTGMRSVESLSSRLNVSAFDAVEALIDVTRSLGSAATSDIQNVLASLAAISSADRVEMVDLTDSVQEIHRLENSSGDTLSDVRVVEGTVLRREISAQRGFDLFIRELHYLGAGRTADAQQSYLRLVRSPAPPPRPVPPRPIPPPRPRPIPPPRPRPVPPRPIPPPQPRPVPRPGPRPVPPPQPRPVPPRPLPPQPRPMPPRPAPAPGPRPQPRPIPPRG